MHIVTNQCYVLAAFYTMSTIEDTKYTSIPLEKTGAHRGDSKVHHKADTSMSIISLDSESCPQWCYSERCPSQFCKLFSAMLLLGLGFGLTAYFYKLQPIVRVMSFNVAQCVVENTVYTGSRQQCSCGTNDDGHPCM